MSATVTERPYQYCLSRNEIRYKFNISDLTPEGLYLQVKLMVQPIGGSEEEIYTATLKPNPDSTVYFYCQQFIDSYLKYVRPVVGDVATDANNQCVQFWVEFREITDADPDPEWPIAPEETHKRLAIKAGVEPWKNARNNFFINYVETDKPFLTWQPHAYPNRKFVFANQKLWLTAFNPANTVASYDIEVTVNYVDSTITATNHTVAVPTAGTLLHIAADLTTLGITGLAGDVHYYDIRVSDGAAGYIAQTYRFYINYDPCYRYYDLYYHNSLGGFDPVRVRGEVTRFFDLDGRDAQGGLQLDDWESANKPFESLITGTTGRRRFAGTVGFANTPREQEALMEILYSESAFQLIDGRWVPIVRVTKSKELNKTTDDLWSFDVEWQLSAQSQSFTPEEQVFGDGDHTETYP